MNSPSTSTTSELDLLGLITAAGESTRMGGFPKPLLHLDDDRFVERIIDHLRGVGAAEVLVVLGHEADAVRATAELDGASVAVNDAYRDGMLSSVQLGVERADRADRSAMVLWPVDYPLAPPSVVRELWEAFAAAAADVVVPTNGGERGHPALFGASTFDDLREAPADEGARAVVYDPETAVVEVPVEDPRILVDIDEPAEYWRAVKAYEIGLA